MGHGLENDPRALKSTRSSPLGLEPAWDQQPFILPNASPLEWECLPRVCPTAVSQEGVRSGPQMGLPQSLSIPDSEDELVP